MTEPPKSSRTITQRWAHPRLGDPDWLRRRASATSAKKIAQELGVAGDTVLRAMRIHGIPVRPNPILPATDGPNELNDGEWLRAQYEHRTANDIAKDLGVGQGTVLRALRVHDIEIRNASERQKFRGHENLHNEDWLRKQYATKSGRAIAEELGVSTPGVHVALRRAGIEADGPWVRRDTTRLIPPSPRELTRIWGIEQTIKGAARQLNVSGTTAERWLADIGIFVSDVPALSKRQLEMAIRHGLGIRQIARQHRVGAGTVTVELRRHGLVEAHRQRPNT